jgi:hypothetical protein
MRKLFLLLAALLLVVSAAAQTAPQPCSAIKPDPVKEKKPSPPGCTDVKFSDGKMLVVTYSRPGINDPQTKQPRVVLGKLIPYGTEWRAGANEATTFETDTNLNVGGTDVPAGSYTLFIQAEQNAPWKLIISKKTGEWGIPYPGKESDLARIDMKTSSLPNTVERFTTHLDKQGGNAATLNFDWEKTRASIAIKEAK